MSGFHRSLALPLGLACTLAFASPARAQADQDAPAYPAETAMQASGAGDLMAAYQLAILAHYDSVLGNDSAAEADLHAATEHLDLAQKAVSSAGGTHPGNPPASNSPVTPGDHQPAVAPGGGGGPAAAQTMPGTGRILQELHTLADTTQTDVTPESTTRLVAAMTGELVNMGRLGGGGGPGRPMPTQITAIEHIGEAYALVGQAQSDLAMANYSEAHGALAQAAVQLRAARKAPGGTLITTDIKHMSDAVESASGPVAAKSHMAPEAVMRAVREITTRLTAMAASPTGSSEEP